jgi:glucose/arabinose dehydrogenase
MKTREGAFVALLLSLVLSGCSAADGVATRASPAPDAAPSPFRLTVVASGLENLVHVASPPGDGRLFVVEQAGRILVLHDGHPGARPFLDITDRVRSGGERGLLSVAFHPRYEENGRLFVDYTDRNGDTRIEEYRVSSDPDRADPASARLLLRVEQPYGNHNGGHLLFGPDGHLWVGMGDGGSGGDPRGNGQDRSTLLGALLRLDVDGPAPFGIPADNPYVDDPPFRPEIWAWGLRNPWRIAFDPTAGRLYVADVGQNHWEEIDVVPADEPGLNFGWNRMEGSHCFRSASCDREGLVLPVVEYGHDDGCSVTGGVVYRGARIPELDGTYLYSDYCRGWIRGFRWSDGEATDHRTFDVESPGAVVSFGTDASGDVYVVTRDRLLRLDPLP